MKTLKKITNIFIFITKAFIVLNILLGYVWSLKTKYNVSGTTTTRWIIPKLIIPPEKKSKYKTVKT